MLEWVVGAGHVVIFEGTQHIHNGIDFTNVGEELVAETFTLAGAFNEAANVNHLDSGMHDALCLRHLSQLEEASVGNLGHANVGVLCGKGIGGCQGSTAGEGVVERGLTCVGETDQTETFHER